MYYNPAIIETISISPENNDNNNNNNNNLIFPLLGSNAISILYVQDIMYRFTKMINKNLSPISEINGGPFAVDFLKKIGISNGISNNVDNATNNNLILNLFYKLYDNSLIYKDSKVVDWCYYLNSPISHSDINIITIDKPTTIMVPVQTADGNLNKEIIIGNTYEIKFELHSENHNVRKIFTESYIDVLKEHDATSNKQYIKVSLSNPEILYNAVAVVFSATVSCLFVINPITMKKMPIIYDKTINTKYIILTPCHNEHHYLLAKKYQLSDECFINSFNESGQILIDDILMDRFTARHNIIQKIPDLVETKQCTFPSTVKICAASGDIIEPRLSSQLFLDCAEIANKIIYNLDKHLDMDENLQNVKLELQNIEPLCISKQSIYDDISDVRFTMYNVISKNLCINDWIVAENLQEVNMIIEREYSSVEDVEIIDNVNKNNKLNDLFISSIKIFCKYMHNNNKDNTFQLYIPITDTKQYVYFFLIAQTIISLFRLNGNIFFYKPNVFVDDNIIDLETFINCCNNEDFLKKIITNNSANKEILLKYIDCHNIPKYSSDALRLTIASTINGKFTLETINDRYLLCERIWNIFMDAISQLDDKFDRQVAVDYNNLEIHNKWIIYRVRTLGTIIETNMKLLKSDECIKLIVDFLINDFCFIIKNSQNNNDKLIIFNILITVLKIIHPFMPFMSQYLYEKLRAPTTEYICNRKWPQFNISDTYEETQHIINEMNKRIHS